MGKRSRVASRDKSSTVVDVAGVGPRQPCPCGSGRRYKNCHGSSSGPAPVFVARPFAGLAAECDLVALRELVPAATAPVRLADSVESDRSVLLCSLLPGAAPALVRQDGTIWLGLQVQHNFGDPSRDLGATLERALTAEPGTMVGLTDPPGEGARLQDLVVDEPLDVTVHDDFGYWLADMDDPDGMLAASLEQANTAINPTAKLTSAPSAYWTSVGTKEHLRWVLPDDEDAVLTALARLHARDEDRLTPDSRLVGMFRAHGLLAPVWDLPVGTGPEAVEDPLSEMATRLTQAMVDTTALTTEERSARSGLANRQVTIR